MAAQVANPPQPLWYAASSPTYPPERMSGYVSMPSFQQTQQQDWRVSTAPQQQQQQQQQQQYDPRASRSGAPGRPSSQRVQSSMMMPHEQAGPRMSGVMAPTRPETQRMSRGPQQEEEEEWGGEYVGFRFAKQPAAAAAAAPPPGQEQEQESSGDSTSESQGSSSAGGSSVDGSIPPAAKGNRKALRKLTRLVKRRGNDIAVITVYNTSGEIICSLPGAQAGQEHTYMPSSEEGKYLFLALERGFKSEGCEFEFGWKTWLSGQQAEVDDKQTMLGNEKTEEARHHRFYGVLSPTGRYVVAAVLKEGAGGQLDAKLLRKIRNTADRFEVYEAWAGSGRLMAKLACAA